MVATLISLGGPLNTNSLSIIQFLTATSYSNSATQIVASFGGGRSQILTGNFVFDGSGALVGGTITGIVESNLAGSSYQIVGLSLPVTSFLSFLNSGDSAGLASALFAGNDGVLGHFANDTLSGGTGADTLSGLKGDDILDGGTGADQLVGEEGNDTYFVDNIGDLIVETGIGTDTVIASTNYGLGLNIENLTLVGTATLAQGNELANVIIGNADVNNLFGLDGNDTLAGNDGSDGLLGGNGNDSLAGGNGNDTIEGEAGNDTLDGGTGKDKMTGGDGDDTYVVDSASDTVVELSGKGTDSVLATIDHTLAINVENLTLTGSALVGTGNTLSNSISGNNLDNQLSGLDGNDTISGGDGKDALTGGQGNDSLLGGDGNDTLDGGPGSDTMEGGKGDDTYLVDASGDLTIEIAGGGTDTVIASVNWQLASEIENLTLVGSALIGSGNDLNNVITGNGSNNELYGSHGNDTIAGGDGNDMLDGGTGADSMNGGLGDDLYLVEGEGEVVAEFEEDGGIDTVHSTGSFTLGSGIENLTLKDGASSGNGNELDNIITGNGSTNFLNGGNGNDTILAGAGDDFVKGNAGNDFLDGGDHNDNIEGGGGADSIFGGAGSDFLLAGDGDDTLAGGIGSDTVAGQVGNDSLDGGAGADYLEGGKGDDVYYVDDTADVAREFAGEGTDTVLSTVNFSLLGLQVENLTLLGSGNTVAVGNGAANLLIGNTGDNVLDGAGGNDTMAGATGDDLYLVEGADVIIENADEGIDMVWAFNDFELAANIEILVAVGAGSKGVGNALANEMYAGENTAALYGLEGADTLIGGSDRDTLIGGTGDDRMEGGSGSDVYGVDSKFDQIIELGGDAEDRVESSIDFELGENLENLVLLSGATVGKGNGGDNQLQGNDGNNALFGYDGNDTMDGSGGNDTLDGGLGSDEMYGGLGDDLFLVDDESDYAYDANFDGGVDTVHSSAASFTLGYNVENLVLKDAAWFGGGNELDNVIIGSESDNSLDGADGNDSISGGAGNDELSGGSGADTLVGGADNDTLFGGADVDSMTGGAGDDLYGVDNKLDVITELSGGGTDTVQSSIDYTLANNFENLVLIDTAYRGTGNSLANVITGNDGVNNLDGGSGNDTIYGGGGNDTLYGSFGNDLVYGGAGNDRIDCLYNQDRAMYTSVLDGHDLLTNFSTGGTGQDYVDLDGLFDSLGVAAADRAGRVSIVDNGGGADVCIDTDGVGGWDLNLASIQYVPDLSAITVGTDATNDVFVGT